MSTSPRQTLEKIISYDGNDVAADITKDGVAELPGLFDPHKAVALLEDIKAIRIFDQSLFLSEEEWKAGSRSHIHTNPGPGNNLLDRVQSQLSFVEDNPQFNALLSDLLGPGHRIYLKKLVCRLPKTTVPEWVHSIIGDKPGNTLGSFIKPEYRDISYYYDVDVHQDILEWPRQPEGQKEHRLLYLYVHLGSVTVDNSPLCFFKGTHRFGATPYQHDITQLKAGSDLWLYRDPTTGRTMETTLFPLVGESGHAAIWHSCTLHGSHPARKNVPRLALRYVLARDPSATTCLLDDINAKVEGLPYHETNFNPGTTANPDGTLRLQHNDFTRSGREGS